MNNFDQLMNDLDERFGILSSNKQYTSCVNEMDKVGHMFIASCKWSRLLRVDDSFFRCTLVLPIHSC